MMIFTLMENTIYFMNIRLYILLIISNLVGCSFLQVKDSKPVEQVDRIDYAKDIIGELSSVVKSYSPDEEIVYFKQKEKVKKERGILRYESKYSYKNKNVGLLLEIVTFNSKVSYTLNISVNVSSDYSVIKRFEIKTYDPDEIISQSANILNSI